MGVQTEQLVYLLMTIDNEGLQRLLLWDYAYGDSKLTNSLKVIRRNESMERIKLISSEYKLKLSS